MINQRKVVQNCYVVPNLEEGCRYLQDLYGIGPCVGGVEAVLDNHVYRGRPMEPIRLRGIFVQSGDLNVELVELLSTTPSAFHDMYPNKGDRGLHHVALFCDDYEAERDRYVALGHEVASEFEVPFGAKICYIDARRTLGHMIELYPEHPVIRGMYAQTVREAQSWDGKTLIVPWD